MFNISVENKESSKKNGYIQAIFGNINKNETIQRQKVQSIQIKSNLSPQLQLFVQNLSLIFLTFSQTVNPLIARMAHKHAKETSQPFINSTIVLNTEKTLKVCVPAIIYVVQNNLYFFVLKRVDATLYTMTFQLRILATAEKDD
uniref:Transmembrane protein n=1 Tax=Meloidogyne hapla TaxID=6305 RepID=A0A1I8B5Z1_MELHA